MLLNCITQKSKHDNISFLGLAASPPSSNLMHGARRKTAPAGGVQGAFTAQRPPAVPPHDPSDRSAQPVDTEGFRTSTPLGAEAAASLPPARLREAATLPTWPPPAVDPTELALFFDGAAAGTGTGGHPLPCYPGFSCRDIDAMARYHNWPKEMTSDEDWLEQ